MNNIVKTLGALAIAGTVAAGGAAFTAGGLDSTVAADQFIGGQVTQTVTGATLESVAYLRAVVPNKVSEVDLVFAGDVTGKTVTLNFDQASNFTCTVVDGTHATCNTVTASNGGVATSFEQINVAVSNG